MTRVALIDYGSGNLASAAKALAHAGRGTGAQIVTTADPDQVLAAERVVLPGVGAFGDCMAGLAAVPGMVAALNEKVRRRGAPFLGICVGMQLLATTGREFGDHPGLDWIAGTVARVAPDDPALKIPHMGWNDLTLTRPHPLFAGLDSGTDFYFVHSFALEPDNAADRLATTTYGGVLTAAVARDNVAGTQFHPEKSQAAGLRLLENFLRWSP